MNVVCNNCQIVIEYEAARPKFCAECGHSIPAETVAKNPAAETATFLPDGDGPRRKLPVWSESDTVDGYRLEEQLGQGGMGVVWRAKQESSGRPVALKLLSASLAGDESHVNRFHREAKLAASFSHPRSTFVFGAGQYEQNPYIVMELMPGQTLQHVVERDGPLSIEKSVDYILDVIDGLIAAHEHDVIHRDVKPSNCFIDSDGRVKVGDFGLSKSLDVQSDLTKTGTFLGTPLYAAPEQIRGETVDERTDLYSVGATLFFLLTGSGPFSGDAVSVIAQIAAEPARKLRELRPELPSGLEKIIDRCLAKQPGKRFASLQDLRLALRPYATGGLAIANVWLRLAAYLIDRTVAQILMTTTVTVIQMGTLVGMGIAGVSGPEIEAFNRTMTRNPLIIILQIAILSLVVAVPERRWGRGIGKWLLGLRLTNMQGERPNSWQVLLRVLFVPGSLGLSVLGAFAGVDMATRSATEMTVIDVLVAFLYGFPATLFPLLLLVTMRKSTRYRALHDILSRTQVVRTSEGVFRSHRKERQSIELKPVAEQQETIGPYRIAGELARTDHQRVLVGEDSVLGRKVWIYLSQDSTEPSVLGRLTPRVTRPHWLQHGSEGEFSWDAYEEIEGTTLTSAIRGAGKNKQKRAIEWLKQLTQELQQSLKENSLPKRLSEHQLWIDSGDNLRLLERPLCFSGDFDRALVEESQSHQASPHQRALDYIHRVSTVLFDGEIIPPDVQQWQQQIDSLPATDDSLELIFDRLHQMSKKPRAMTWDSRMATLAIAGGVENAIYTAFSMICLMLVANWLPQSTMTTGLIVTAIQFGVIGYLAVRFCGGPAFYFLGFAVRRKDGGSASALRLVVRNLLAWLPIVASFNLMWVVLALVISGIQSGRLEPGSADSLQVSAGGPQVELEEESQDDTPADQVRSDEEATDANSNRESGKPEEADSDLLPTESPPLIPRIQLQLLVLAIPVCFLLTSIVGLFAVIFPRRSLQDYICGTSLFPK